MADHQAPRTRHGEAFWRAHHEAWKHSDLNQRENCAAQGIPLKAFGNWRAKFTVEPEAPVRLLLYRRGGLSHTLARAWMDWLSWFRKCCARIRSTAISSPSGVAGPI